MTGSRISMTHWKVDQMGQDEVSGSGANAEKHLNEGSHLKTALVSEGLTSPVPESASLSSISINLAWSPLQLLNTSSTLEDRDVSSGIAQSLRGSPPSAQVEVSSPPLARRMKER